MLGVNPLRPLIPPLSCSGCLHGPLHGRTGLPEEQLERSGRLPGLCVFSRHRGVHGGRGQDPWSAAGAPTAQNSAPAEVRSQPAGFFNHSTFVETELTFVWFERTFEPE